MGASNSVIVDVVGVLLHSGLVGFSLQKSVISGANVVTAGTAGHSAKVAAWLPSGQFTSYDSVS